MRGDKGQRPQQIEGTYRRMIRPHVLIAGLAVAACAPNSGIYTLYRASPLDANLRIHVATFDSKDGDAYNRENCDQAATLFQQQPGVTVKFWCEKGHYRE